MTSTIPAPLGHPRRAALLLGAVCLSLLTTGCAGSAQWGAHATLTPGWERVRVSAVRAATSAHTWVPLAGAALFAIEDFDEQTVDWASRRNPLFGDIKDAKDASDRLDDLAKLSYLATALLAPSGEGMEAVGNKARGLALGVAAITLNEGLTNGMKDTTNRQRPDREERNSFPSLHASRSAVTATLAARNLQHFELGDGQRRALQGALYGVAGLTGWARVEGQRHYPSDVLVGYALGHFIGAFINDAFIAPEGRDTSLGLHVVAGPGEVLTGIHYHW